VRAGSIQQGTLTTSFVLAGAMFVVAGLAGQALLGVGVGIGMIIGSLNGFIIKAALDRGAPMLVTSFLRLVLFSLLAVGAARLIGGSVWPVVIGIGVTQMVMVGFGVREGLRA
jgi:hypothetical protein